MDYSENEFDPEFITTHSFGQLAIMLYDGRLLAVGVLYESGKMLVLRAGETINQSTSMTVREIACAKD